MNINNKYFYLVIYLLVQSQVFALGRTKAIPRTNYVLESFEEYEFKACEKYNKEDDFEYFISCKNGLVKMDDKLENLKSDIHAINLNYFKNNFLSHIKDESLSTLKEQQKNIENITKCIETRKTKKNLSNLCQVLLSNLESSTRSDLKKIREYLSISTKPSFFAKKESSKEIFSREIEHHIKDTKIPPLSQSERKEIKNREDFIDYTLTQKWLSDNASKNKCIYKSSNETYKIKQDSKGRYNCETMTRIAINKFKENNIEQIRKEAKSEYFKLINKTPLLASLNLVGDENSDRIFNEYSSQLKSLNNNIKESIQKIENLNGNQRYSLISNKAIVENYLEKQGPPEFLCSIAQDYKDKIFYDELKTDFLVVGGAVVGGGICGLTAGLGCAIGAAIVAEAVSIGVSKNRNDNEEQLFSSGLSHAQQLEEREQDFTLSLITAPLALGGEFLGKGIKQGVKLERSLASAEHEVINSSESLLTKYQKSKYFEETASATIKAPKNSDQLIHEYENFNLTTPSLNRRWISSAKKNDAAFFVDVENAALKRLNDSLGNKSLVTAFTNLHKDIFSKKVFEILKKYPGINFELYSDFKSVRFAFSPKSIAPEIKDALLKEMNGAFTKTNEEFSVIAKNIVSLSAGEHPEKWFAAGISQTADEAGLAAKKARNLDRSKNEIVSFTSIKASVQREIDNISAFQKNVIGGEKFLNANVATKVPGTDKYVFSEEFIDLIRKTPAEPTSKQVDQLVSKIKTVHNINLTPTEASNINHYVHKLNNLTPGLWNEVRENANLDGAIYGGITGDVTGLGASNIRQVALDIASLDSKARTEDAIAKIRQGEVHVTKQFNDIKKNFELTMREVLQKRGIGHNVKCSGDDCVVIITEAIDTTQQHEIIRTFTKQANPSQYRMSFVPPNAPLKSQTNIAVHGEMVEKELRQSLKGIGPDLIDPIIMRKLCFGMSMPNSLKSGPIELLISSANDVNLTKNQLELIKSKFNKAVTKVNSNLSLEQTDEAKYLASQMYYMK